MPIGPLKNTLYGLALPVLGKKCEWKQAEDAQLGRLLLRHHTVGACVQRFQNGKLTDCHAVGYARLQGERTPVVPETVFRTASLAKMVTALLVFRLQTTGRLSVQQDVSEWMGYPVRNPHFPDAPVTLAMLLSHTSGMVDSQVYFEAFHKHTPLRQLVEDESAWLPVLPGTAFRYSNLAAGMVGCILEKQTGMSLETLAQQELFQPLEIKATFDLSKAETALVADIYRVLPAKLAFDAQKRTSAARPLDEPDPEQHYLLASGNLYLTATDLAKLAMTAWNGADGFLDETSLHQMQSPLHAWPEKEVPMRHGMGLLQINDSSIYPEAVWGHQGFAYGAVNGVFFDARGNGFACLNSGTSERRKGHLALINRDLIHWAMNTQGSDS